MKKLSILICLAGTLALSGCTKIQSSSPEDGYNTEFAMSATEYSIFLSKQIENDNRNNGKCQCRHCHIPLDGILSEEQ